MKSQDPKNKIADFAQQRNYNQESYRQDGLFNYMNEERIPTSVKIKQPKTYYYDNYEISLSYGQSNIEKCLFVILVCIFFSVLLIYKYFLDLHTTILYIFISSCFVDIIITLFYVYFLIKLRRTQILLSVFFSISVHRKASQYRNHSLNWYTHHALRTNLS